MVGTLVEPLDSTFSPAAPGFVLPGVDWSAYQKISEALTGRHVRLGYDHGRLEFMTISPKHGNISRLLGRLVATLAEETDRPLRSFGDMTCDREDLERGIEPDECFYIDHEPDIRGKDELDLAVDPPPDLGIEVDITSRSTFRLGIYAALQVPEIWQFDGQNVTILILKDDDRYVGHEHSRTFPLVTSTALSRFVGLRLSTDESRLIKSFRAWIWEQSATRLAPDK